MYRDKIAATSVAALCLALFSCGDEPARLTLEKAKISVGGKEITVELARRPEEQARGLMYRRKLGENDGMLFAYDSPRVMSFWMKNTRIPLSIAFIDGAGTIIQIEKMRPFDNVSRHVSRGPAQYALEMNQGWFEKNGVKVGDKVEIPNRLTHLAR